MKITITQDFDTPKDALAFLARVQGPSPAPVAPPAAAAVGVVGQPGPTLPQQQAEQPAAKKPRKGRSDAGQQRGPYKTTTGGSAASEPGQTGSNSVPTPMPAAPVSPTQSAVPAKSSAVEPPQAAPAPATVDWTLEAVRAEMGKLHAIPNKGTTACLAALKHFGVARISDLPKEKYAEFVKYVHEQVAA